MADFKLSEIKKHTKTVIARYCFAWFQAIEFGCQTTKKSGMEIERCASILFYMHRVVVCISFCFTCNYEKF